MTEQTKVNQTLTEPAAQETVVATQPLGASGQQGKTPVSHAGGAGSVTREAHQLTAREIAKFWSRVQGGEDYQCWEWQGTKVNGYGRCHKTRAHRVAYELVNGSIPEGMMVRHKCDNPLCCNPKHLLIGSASDNMQDAKERGRLATRTRHGHAKLTEDDVAYIKQNAHLQSLRQLADRFGVARSTISFIKNGKTWA